MAWIGQRCYGNGNFFQLIRCAYFDSFIQIARCDICQRINKKLTTGVPELNPIPVKSPWRHIGIDFIGPISPPGNDGSRFILTICDYFTKWVEAIPTSDKGAITVANHLFKVIICIWQLNYLDYKAYYCRLVLYFNCYKLCRYL